MRQVVEVVQYAGQLVMTYREYKRIVVVSLGSRLRWAPWAGAALAVLGVVLLIAGAGSPFVLIGLLVTGVLTALLPDLLAWHGWRRIRGLTAEPWRYEIGAEQVGIHTPQTDVTIPWRAISRARITRHVWTVTVASTGLPVPFPRAAFGADAPRVDELIRRSGKLVES